MEQSLPDPALQVSPLGRCSRIQNLAVALANMTPGHRVRRDSRVVWITKEREVIAVSFHCMILVLTNSPPD